jgi:hypothetical protein
LRRLVWDLNNWCLRDQKNGEKSENGVKKKKTEKTEKTEKKRKKERNKTKETQEMYDTELPETQHRKGNKRKLAMRCLRLESLELSR